MRTTERKKGETTLIRGRKSWCSCWVLSVALALALLLDHLLNLLDKETSLDSDESDGRRHVRKLKLRRRLGGFVLGSDSAKAAATSDDDCGIG